MTAAATALAQMYQRKRSRIEILRDVVEIAERALEIAQSAGLI